MSSLLFAIKSEGFSMPIVCADIEIVERAMQLRWAFNLFFFPHENRPTSDSSGEIVSNKAALMPRLLIPRVLMV